MKADIRLSPDVRDVLNRSVTMGCSVRSVSLKSVIVRLPPGTPGMDPDGRVTAASLWVELARQQVNRFWGYVQKRGADECWVWTGGKDKDGYGKFAIGGPRVNGKQQQRHVRAHRLSYEFVHGPLSADTLLLHSCDTPACVNPSHLSTGTQAQNRADCVARGRTAKGARHGSHTMPHRWRRGVVDKPRAVVAETPKRAARKPEQVDLFAGLK